MLEKKFTNKDLGIELNSYIDKQQNVWFRGKDVAEILGYSKARNAIERHVSLENKVTKFVQPKCCPGKTGRQQNDTKVKCSPGKTPGQQNDTRGGVSPPQQSKSVGGVKTPPQQSKSVGGPETGRQQNDTKVKCSPGKTPGQQNDTRGKYCTFINEPGFYELVFGSKLEFAKKFRQ